jgi:hypothetical protein
MGNKVSYWGKAKMITLDCDIFGHNSDFFSNTSTL